MDAISQQVDRKAKKKRKRRTPTLCPLCHNVVVAVELKDKVVTTCLAYEVRPRSGRSRWSDKTLGVEYVENATGEATCHLVKSVSDLEYHLTRDQEAARQQVRSGQWEAESQ